MEGVPVSDIGILWVAFSRNFFRFFSEKIFFEIFSWVSVGIECSCVVLMSFEVVECPCIEILILRLFLGDFRRGK